MERNESLLPVAKFIAEYAAHMMGSGVHTSRVKRSSKRIGKAFNTDIKLNVSQKTIVISATHNETGETYSEVVDIPALPISFEHNAELSALSWETYDQHLSLEEVRQKYNEIVSAPKMDPMFVLILVGLANASFCRLFGGDWLSMGIVLSATITGMFLRQRMQANHINHYVVFAVSAFVASLCASTSLIFDTTSEIALATSVLYLIPGVPLINGIIDIVENRVVGMKSRGVYETPGGTILMEAHQQLEELVLDRATYEVKKEMGNKLSQIVYEGKWFTPLREAVQAFIESTQQYVTGEVKLKLYKGNIIKAGTTSPYSLYSESLASFTTGELYDHHDAEGFINLFGLPLKVRAMKLAETEK